LLDAIAALDVEKPAPADERVPASAERRQLTVMFCDLVGSTELSTRLDPEDLREVIGAYHGAVGEIVSGFDGFVSRYMGDGVLIYFGYPQAHEDDAERAVRAGLSALDAVGRLDIKSVKLQTRVGIATGLVVVGDLIGEDRHRNNRSSAKRRTSPPGCKPWPSRTRWSSPPARAGWSAISSSTAISAPSRSRASPPRCGRGR
jgi:class 3 adenylate cyclase